MINFDMYNWTLIDLTAFHTAEVNVTTASLSVNVGLHTPISYCGALFELPVKKVGIEVDVHWKRTQKWLELKHTTATLKVNLQDPTKTTWVEHRIENRPHQPLVPICLKRWMQSESSHHIKQSNFNIFLNFPGNDGCVFRWLVSEWVLCDVDLNKELKDFNMFDFFCMLD